MGRPAKLPCKRHALDISDEKHLAMAAAVATSSHMSLVIRSALSPTESVLRRIIQNLAVADMTHGTLCKNIAHTLIDDTNMLTRILEDVATFAKPALHQRENLLF